MLANRCTVPPEGQPLARSLLWFKPLHLPSPFLPRLFYPFGKVGAPRPFFAVRFVFFTFPSSPREHPPLPRSPEGPRLRAWPPLCERRVDRVPWSFIRESAPLGEK